MAEEKLVSVITVTYNAQDYLEQTIRSVLGQIYSDIEYIIIDGGSTDGTIDIIKKYESRIFRWISEKDNGIYDAMNKGIRMANGELVGMINAGDYYEPDAVGNMVAAYSDNPDYGIFHGKINLLDEKGDFIKTKNPQSDLSALFKGMCVYHPTFFVLKTIYEKNGLYDLSFRIAADYDLTLRNYLKGTRFYYVDKVIACFRAGGYSHQQSQKALAEVCDSLVKNGCDEKQVREVRVYLKKKDRKNHLLFCGHSFFKKILPKFLLDKIASAINTSK